MTLALFQALDQLDDRLAGPLSIRRWPGGVCNRLFRLSGPTGEFALRLNHPASDRLGVDRRRETELLAALADYSWCPGVLASSDAWLLTAWQPGQPPASGAQTDLDWLAGALAEVAAAPAPGPVLNIADQIGRLLEHGPALPRPVAERLQACREAYHLPEKTALCHHDWHPGNLVVSGENWILLDWEFAARGDPAMDLAAACLGFELNADQSAHLAATLDIGEERLKEAHRLMAALAMVWYRANPDLATEAAQSPEEWLGHRG